MTTNVLPTKLFVPAPDRDVVTRHRLLEVLSVRHHCPLVLISAPAGAGKTTLVANWVQGTEAPFGWMSLDARDNDPPAFLACLVEVCSALRPDAGERAAALLASTPPPEPAVVAAALISDLARSGAAGTVVLDDYHLVEDSGIHEIVAHLIERMPPGIRLVLVTRNDPPLPLARLRARGQLAEIRAQDLRFDTAEATAFLERLSDRRLRPESIAALADRTEGWAAGLQLAGLALRTAADPDAFVAGFAGTHAFVADYLTDEVLDGLSLEQQEFLVRSSVLNRLSGPLCDAALVRSGSDDMLDALGRANLFLVPLDGERRWFRYHHLFRDLLRRRFQSRRNGERRQILIRASAWCESNGHADDAIRYAVDAGDTELAADLVARHALQALAAGQALTTRRWIRLLPDEVVRSSPDHSVIAAWSHSLVEEHGPVAAYAECARARLAAGERPYPNIEEVEAHVQVLLAGVLTLGDAVSGAAAANDQFNDALAGMSPENLLLRASAEVMSGNALNLQTRYEEALPAFTRCYEVAERAGSDLLRLAAETGRAESLLFQANPRAAVVVVDNALGRRRALREIIGSQAANLYAIRAMAHLEAGEQAAAREDVRHAWSALGASEDGPEAWRGVARTGYGRPSAFHSATPGVFYGFMVYARLLIGRLELSTAADLLDQLEEQVSTSASPIARAALDALRVRLWIAADERIRLQRWSRSARPMTTGCGFWDQTSVLTNARAALGAGDPGTGLHLLEQLLRELDGGPARLTLAEASVLHAVACAAAGRTGAAEASADAALELASTNGLTAVWIDERESVRPLLQGAVARATASAGALSHALDLIAGLDSVLPSRAATGFTDLSERELEILRRVAAGHSNQEIAEALFVAVGTVKKHTHNIYQKMGVSSRTQAVHAAREHGLLARQE